MNKQPSADTRKAVNPAANQNTPHDMLAHLDVSSETLGKAASYIIVGGEGG